MEKWKRRLRKNKNNTKVPKSIARVPRPVLDACLNPLLKFAYPSMTKIMRKRVVQLIQEKKVNILSSDIDNIIASVLRHSETTYESQLVCGSGKKYARSVIKIVIGKEPDKLKKEQG